MDRNILKPSEIAEALKDLQVAPKDSVFYDIMQELNKAVESLAITQRSKLPHDGLFQNEGNLKPFTSLVIKRFGRNNVSQSTHDGRKSIQVMIENDELTLDISDDHVDIKSGFNMELRIGLHSSFYDDVMHFVFDTDSEFNKLIIRYHLVKRSLNLYLKRYSELFKTSKFQSALKDKSAYDEFRKSYDQIISELQPLDEYLSLKKWEDFFRAQAINSYVNEITRIRSILTEKPERSYKYQKKYNKALSVLERANMYNLLTPEEAQLIESFDEFIYSVTGEENNSPADCGYMESVGKIFEQKLRECNELDTPYMLKKKSKIEADIELCKTLKTMHGLDCFIDQSCFRASAGHFNVVSNDNMVWVFRIGRSTPEIDICSRYIEFVKVLERIGEAVGKRVKFKEAGFRYADGKLYVSAFGIDPATVDTFSGLLKGIRYGRLEITNSYVHIMLPVGELEWQISLRTKTAEETVTQSMPLIKQYLDIYKNGKDISVKGIFKERLPNL